MYHVYKQGISYSHPYNYPSYEVLADWNHRYPPDEEQYYNTSIGTAKYKGGISSMTWKAGTESAVRGYKFSYDGLDRMQNATYGETASINTNANRFSENVTAYDKNGNIKTLQRYGQTSASAYGLLDNLTYTLTGNQLNRVDDAVTTAAYGTNTAFVNGASAAGEYAYDANGNLTQDLNKGITGITYNVLNLPSVITFSDKSTITYTYAADGTKLRTVHKIGSTTTTTDYCGNVIYENGIQKFLLTEEGYVNLTGTQQYHYYLKDHQGNNRVVINQDGTVEETNHYYSFGGLFASTTVQPYKYNGKEYDTKKGLNWYDYGARHYDAALGRFTTMDPLTEKYYNYSPYTYCLNSPVTHVDQNGEFPILAGIIGGGIDYATQVLQNRIEGKSWSASLTDVDTKSIVVSAATSMAGVGFANVLDKGMKTVKIVQTGTKVATAVKVTSDVAVNGTVSAASQLLEKGEVSGKNMAVDVASGFIGGKVGNLVKSAKQSSPNGKILSRQADHARRVAGSNPRASRAEKLRVATQKATTYGNNAAEATSTVISNSVSISLNKIQENDKRK